MAFVSLDSPSCRVPCLILHSVVYRDVTRQTKGLYHLKHVEALKIGLTYLSRCNSGWFCHKLLLRNISPHHIEEAPYNETNLKIPIGDEENLSNVRH
jgi:hypothetical protein